jgi:hypothetical protein
MGASKWVDSLRLLLAAAGIALIGYGAWLHYPPLGFLVAGALVLALSVAGAMRSSR